MFDLVPDSPENILRSVLIGKPKQRWRFLSEDDSNPADGQASSREPDQATANG